MQRWHTLFDLSLRDYETQLSEQHFEYRPDLFGTCGSIAGPAGTVVRFFDSKPEWAWYRQEYNVVPAFALVQPMVQNGTIDRKRRVVGTPVYVLNNRDPTHWYWEALAGTEAHEDEFVYGSRHQVTWRQVGNTVSDPTIEQYDPKASIANLMYIVEAT